MPVLSSVDVASQGVSGRPEFGLFSKGFTGLLSYCLNPGTGDHAGSLVTASLISVSNSNGSEATMLPYFEAVSGLIPIVRPVDTCRWEVLQLVGKRKGAGAIPGTLIGESGPKPIPRPFASLEGARVQTTNRMSLRGAAGVRDRTESSSSSQPALQFSQSSPSCGCVLLRPQPHGRDPTSTRVANILGSSKMMMGYQGGCE